MTKHIFNSPLYLFVSIGCLVLGGCIAEAETGSSVITATDEVKAGGTGALCGIGAAYAPCKSGHVCTGASGGEGACRAIAREGQRCGAGIQALCRDGLVCSAAPGGEGVCRSRVVLGKACGGAHPPCENGLFCEKASGGVGSCQRGG